VTKQSFLGEETQRTKRVYRKGLNIATIKVGLIFALGARPLLLQQPRPSIAASAAAEAFDRRPPTGAQSNSGKAAVVAAAEHSRSEYDAKRASAKVYYPTDTIKKGLQDTLNSRLFKTILKLNRTQHSLNNVYNLKSSSCKPSHPKTFT